MSAAKFLVALGIALVLHLVGARLHQVDLYLPQAVDLFLPIVVLNSLVGGSLAGLLGGLAAGLLQDAVTGGVYGLHGFANTLVGYAIARLAQRLVIQRAVGVFGIAAFASALQQVLLIALSLFLLPQASVPEPFWVVIRSVTTGLIGMVIYTGAARFRIASERHRRNRMGRLRMESRL